LQQQQIPGLTGTLPLRAEELILSAGEKSMLKSLGWREGDPVPANLPDLVAAAMAEKKRLDADTQQVLKKMASQPSRPLQVPAEIDIKKLPPARQAALEAAMAQARSSVSAVPSRPQGIPAGDYSPSVQAALQGNEPVIELVSPNTQSPAAEPAPQPTAPQPEIPGLPGLPQANAGGGLKPEVPPVKVTAADRMLYVQTILGGRFFREYDFFGGRLKATFRTLSVADNERCLAQCAAETANKQLLTIDDFYRRYFDYRLCLSLHALTVNDAPLDIASSVDEVLATTKPSDLDVLPSLREQLLQEPVLNSESVWRLLGEAAQEFNRLVLALEKESRDPNFLQAIDG
jgi:hypothetical protein